MLSTNNLINCLVFTNNDSPPWKLTFVYSPPNCASKHGFWDSLDAIGRSFEGPWMIIGDFNAVLNSADKLGGLPVSRPSRGGLRGLIYDHGLIDSGFIGCPYT